VSAGHPTGEEVQEQPAVLGALPERSSPTAKKRRLQTDAQTAHDGSRQIAPGVGGPALLPDATHRHPPASELDNPTRRVSPRPPPSPSASQHQTEGSPSPAATDPLQAGSLSPALNAAAAAAARAEAAAAADAAAETAATAAAAEAEADAAAETDTVSRMPTPSLGEASAAPSARAHASDVAQAAPAPASLPPSLGLSHPAESSSQALFALTIRQPFASAILDGRKTVENRTFSPPRLGPGGMWIAVHAGASVATPGDSPMMAAALSALKREWPGMRAAETYLCSAVLGLMHVKDVVSVQKCNGDPQVSDWGQGWSWLSHPFPTPFSGSALSWKVVCAEM
jgi:hypothetical protein